MIPKKIHYCWFGKKRLPKELEGYIKTWRKFCPDYEIIEWNETNFDVDSHPFMKAAYEAKAWAFVSDYARLKIVYDNGGIYLDTDVEIMRNLDFLLVNQCFIGVQQLGNLCATGLGFGAEVSNQVVLAMMKKYDDLIFDINKKRELACPILNNSVIQSLGYKYVDEIVQLKHITVFPSKFMDPISPGNSKNLICEDTFFVHHYSASWENTRKRVKRRVINKIGQNRLNLLKKILGFH